METFLHAVSSVTLILLLTATGYLCAAKHWMGPEAKAFISKFLMTIAIPSMCIYNFRNNLSRELLGQSVSMLLAGFCSCLLDFILAFALGKLLRLPRCKLGIFVMMCAVPNCVFIGLAMCTELFGSECTPQVMLYWVVSTSFMQLGGVSFVRWSGESGGFSAKTFLHFLRTPAIIGTLAGILIVLFDIRLPSLVMSYARYMNNVVTPLALLLTGYIIHDIGLRNLHLDRILSVMMAFRFIAAPAICLGFCILFGVTGLTRNVYIVEAAMPVVTQTVVAAAAYGADEQFAAQGAALSTLACFIVTPILMMLL